MFIFNNKKFINPVCEIVAFNKVQFFDSIDKIQKLKKDYYLAGYISYAAWKFFNYDNEDKKDYSTNNTPLLYFKAYKDIESFNYKDYKKDKSYNNSYSKDCELYIKENIKKEEYLESIEKIKEYIKNGTTYELNYTYSNDIFSAIDGFSLYLSLLDNQNTPYCAYIDNQYSEILSFSPELFFEIKNNRITTKPMKGTIKRQGDDRKEIEFLKNDIKNRAENTMIVDLIRNDLARIESSSNIKVDKLFEVETHKTLHQMTSCISAQLSEINIYNILSSLFPCGSVTGAPKLSTMELIEKIENYKRNIYCGLIGYFYKNEALTSVPIRILEKDKTKDELKYKFLQGGAIVYRSKAEEEYQECLTKRLFLGESIDFSLIETILIKNNKPQLYLEHLQRLKNSAKYFGFRFNDKLLNKEFENNTIARIELYKNGEFDIQYREINPLKTNRIIISKQKVYSKNPFLFHKTTYKPYYQESYQKINNNEILDTVYFNEKNELTEGSRTNILLLKNNILYTPKLSCGLLRGVGLGSMFRELKNQLQEKILYQEDLEKADRVFLVNSIRGIVEARLETTESKIRTVKSNACNIGY